MSTIKAILKLIKPTQNLSANIYQITGDIITVFNEDIWVQMPISNIYNTSKQIIKTNYKFLNDIKDMKEINIDYINYRFYVNNYLTDELILANEEYQSPKDLNLKPNNQILDLSNIDLSLMITKDMVFGLPYSHITLSDSTLSSTDRFIYISSKIDINKNIQLAIPPEIKICQKLGINQFQICGNQLISDNDEVILTCQKLVRYQPFDEIASQYTLGDKNDFDYKQILNQINNKKLDVTPSGSLSINLDNQKIKIPVKMWVDYLKKIKGDYSYQLGTLDNTFKVLFIENKKSKTRVILALI